MSFRVKRKAVHKMMMRIMSSFSRNNNLLEVIDLKHKPNNTDGANLLEIIDSDKSVKKGTSKSNNWR